MKTKLTLFVLAAGLALVAVLGGNNLGAVIAGNPIPPGACPPVCSK